MYSILDKLYTEAIKVTYVEWAALACVLPGVWYICVQVSVRGLWFMFLAQFFWLWHAINTDQLILGFQAILLNLLNTYGIINWMRNKVGKCNEPSKD